MNVGFNVSHTTSTDCVAAVHPGPFGETASVIVTVCGVAGHVNTGVALAVLSNVPAVAVHHEVLVNLGDDAPAGFESYARLIEIVSTDPADRATARARWKHYAARGYPIQRHEVQA